MRNLVPFIYTQSICGSPAAGRRAILATVSMAEEWQSSAKAAWEASDYIGFERACTALAQLRALDALLELAAPVADSNFGVRPSELHLLSRALAQFDDDRAQAQVGKWLDDILEMERAGHPSSDYFFDRQAEDLLRFAPPARAYAHLSTLVRRHLPH